MKGFSFRQGKRLHKRYPPGYIVGKHTFFLKMRGHTIDDDDEGVQHVVSSKLGDSAEIWILRPQCWEQLPNDVKLPLAEMLCLQLAESTRHSGLQER